ncbi:hypothetical protein ACFVHB_11445 [Kitasatospora sp. NPDC127111]|uniref:WXG100-like domain-containing protein n=1 Tax=Kitasatospora sp. NPDC127111 TaxID=3345363 RepID=UPI00363A487A
MATELPEPLQWVLLLLSGTRWPEADEDNLRNMAGHWRSMAQTLKDVEESADAAVKRALVGQVGVAATGLSQYWDKFTVGAGEAQPGVLPGLAKACEGMGDMLESMANSAETAKIQIIAQLGILAAEIATAEVEAPFTAGLSLAQIPVMVGISRTVVQQILKKLAMEAMKFAAKQAVQMAAINLLAQSIQVLEGHRKGLDLKELGDNAAGGAVAGASGNLLGKGIGAAGSKVGLGRALGTVPGKMVTAGAVGVGADVITQAVTTGKVDGHSLLGSGLSGASAAGLHAAGAAVNGHFKAPAVDVPGGGVHAPGGSEIPAGAHVPEHAPAAAPGGSAGAEGAAGTSGSRGLPAASEHVAGAEAPAAAAHNAPAGGAHEGVPAGGGHPAAEAAGGAAHAASHPAADGGGSAQSQGHPAAPSAEHGTTGGGSPSHASGPGGEGGTPAHGPSAATEGGAPGHAEAPPVHGAGTHAPVTEASAPTAAGAHPSAPEGTPAQHAGPAATHEPTPAAAAVPHEGAATPAASHASSLPPLHEGGAVSAPAPAAHETPLPGGGHHGVDLPQVHLSEGDGGSVSHPVAEGSRPVLQHGVDLPQVHLSEGGAGSVSHPVAEGSRPVLQHGVDLPQVHLPQGDGGSVSHPVAEGSRPVLQHGVDLPQVHLQTEAASLAASEVPVRPVGAGADEIRLAGPAEGTPSGTVRPVSGMPDFHGTPLLHGSATTPVAGTSASAAAHPTAQPGRPGAHVPPLPEGFTTGPVHAAPPARAETSPPRVEGRPPREVAAGTERPVRPLHEHPAGPALVYPFQKSALHKAFDRAGRLFGRSADNPVISDLMNHLPHKSAGGKYVNAVVGDVPIEGARLNTRTKTFKTDLDPTTFNDLSTGLRRTLLSGTGSELQRLPSYKWEFSGHERIEFLARQDYRTADYWRAQDARRDQLDALAAANAERAPAGLPEAAQNRVDAVLHDSPDVGTGAGRVLADHGGFVLGENHNYSPSWAFLKENLPALKEHGVDTLYLEALRGDSFQKHMDAYLRAPEGAAMPPELDVMATRYDKERKSPQGNGLYDVLAAAKAEGVRVQFVDGLPAARPDGPWGLYDRAARFNTLAADFIEGDTGRAGKYILVAGSAHVHPHDPPEGVDPVTPHHSANPAPGLSQLLGVPGLELADRPGVEPLAPGGSRPLEDLRLMRLHQAG